MSEPDETLICDEPEAPSTDLDTPSQVEGQPREKGGLPTLRRMRKNLREKARRQELNEKFVELSMLLDPAYKVQKSTILHGATVEIRVLRSELQLLRDKQTELDNELREGKRNADGSKSEGGRSGFSADGEYGATAIQMRKIRKNIQERKRRLELNEKFEELCGLLELPVPNRTTKFTILTRTIQEIKELRAYKQDLLFRISAHKRNGATNDEDQREEVANQKKDGVSSVSSSSTSSSPSFHVEEPRESSMMDIDLAESSRASQPKASAPDNMELVAGVLAQMSRCATPPKHNRSNSSTSADDTTRVKSERDSRRLSLSSLPEIHNLRVASPSVSRASPTNKRPFTSSEMDERPTTPLKRPRPQFNQDRIKVEGREDIAKMLPQRGFTSIDDHSRRKSMPSLKAPLFGYAAARMIPESSLLGDHLNHFNKMNSNLNQLTMALAAKAMERQAQVQASMQSLAQNRRNQPAQQQPRTPSPAESGGPARAPHSLYHRRMSAPDISKSRLLMKGFIPFMRRTPPPRPSSTTSEDQQ